MSHNTNNQAATLKAIRAHLKNEGLDALWIPSADEHINEYLPVHTQRRSYVTGFTGSAGDCLVTTKEAFLFVDSRYHEQADSEVDLNLFTVSKLGEEGHPTFTEQIKKLSLTEKVPFVLGYHAYTMSVSMQQALKKSFEGKPIELKPLQKNIVDDVWDERPEQPANPVFHLSKKYTGQTVEEKISTIRNQIKEKGASVLPVTKLDQIAWLFNLRGQDISYNPVFISYAIVTQDAAFLFTDESRLEASAKEALQKHVQVLPYGHYTRALKSMIANKTVLIDAKHTTVGTLQIVERAKAKVLYADNPIEMAKAVKNKTEIKWMKEAHVKAGRAKTKAFKWLEKQLKAENTVTEKSFADALEGLYAKEEDFKGLSFNTISGGGASSSIVHYGTPSDKKALKKGDWFLVDSGCQFLGGTTDDTRTTVIGEPTMIQIQHYTLVLKAHIACARQIFPKGTTGTQLDAITRSALWQKHLNFGHGTGHGVGAFLNVHEGPQNISPRSTVPLEPGMVVSIEPGYYKPGWGGIRIENLYLVKEVQKGWYGFESLTVIPFEKKLIDNKALTADEKQWLKDYNEQIKATFS